MSQYGEFPSLENSWYQTSSKEKPTVLAEQITDRIILLRRNVVESKNDKDETIYIYEERAIGVDQWEAYQDIWDNANNIEIANEGLMETYEATSDNTSEIEDLNNAVIELYELITAEE